MERMDRYAVLKVYLDNGQTDTWEAKSGMFDGYACDGRTFTVKKDGAVVGIYSMAHMISAIIE